MTRVTVLGMGPGSPDLLSGRAVAALAEADAIVGARRLVDDARAAGLVSADAVARTATRAADIASFVTEHAGLGRICVLMSGDTGLYSGAPRAAERLRALPGVQLEVVPGISSVQYLAARLQRAWHPWRVVSAHGVSVDAAAEVRRADPAPTLFICGGTTTPGALCAELSAAGLAGRPVTAAERLSYPDERIVSGAAGELAGRAFDGLSLLLVEGADDGGPTASGDDPWPWSGAGIADDRFERARVPMTKQEVRAVALAKLRVAATDTVFDIGAGTGSVTVELARAAWEGRVVAIERKPEAVALARRNVERFGLKNAQVIEGAAPAALAGLPRPDAAFIGGSGGSLAGILDALRAANPGIRLCISCITLDTLAEAARLLAEGPYRDVDIACVNVSRAETVGGYRMMRAQNPVWLLAATADGGTGAGVADA